MSTVDSDSKSELLFVSSTFRHDTSDNIFLSSSLLLYNDTTPVTASFVHFVIVQSV